MIIYSLSKLQFGRIFRLEVTILWLFNLYLQNIYLAQCDFHVSHMRTSLIDERVKLSPFSAVPNNVTSRYVAEKNVFYVPKSDLCVSRGKCYTPDTHTHTHTAESTRNYFLKSPSYLAIFSNTYLPYHAS